MYTMGMMKQQTPTKPKEMYVRITNIHWNEGPEYKGPQAFWFVVTADTYKKVSSDPVHKLALFQKIENELEDASEYAGIASDLLEFEWVRPDQLKDKASFKRWGFNKGDTFECTELTDIKL